MYTDFYLTIVVEDETAIADVTREARYQMAICIAYPPNVKAEPIFLSKSHNSKLDLEVVGEAYAKRLNIIYKEPD